MILDTRAIYERSLTLKYKLLDKAISEIFQIKFVAHPVYLLHPLFTTSLLLMGQETWPISKDYEPYLDSKILEEMVPVWNGSSLRQQVFLTMCNRELMQVFLERKNILYTKHYSRNISARNAEVQCCKFQKYHYNVYQHTSCTSRRVLTCGRVIVACSRIDRCVSISDIEA
jgi:hypothetical protein